MFGTDGYEVIEHFKRIIRVIVGILIVICIFFIAWVLSDIITPKVTENTDSVDVDLREEYEKKEDVADKTSSEPAGPTASDIVASETSAWSFLSDSYEDAKAADASTGYTPATAEELELCEGVLSWLTVIHIRAFTSDLVVNLNTSNKAGVVIYNEWVFECTKDAYHWCIQTIYKTDELTQEELGYLSGEYTIIERDGTWVCELR